MKVLTKRQILLLHSALIQQSGGADGIRDAGLLDSAVILKNNAPRYIIYEFNQADAMQAAADDDVLASSLKLMDRNKRVYEELAK